MASTVKDTHSSMTILLFPSSRVRKVTAHMHIFKEGLDRQKINIQKFEFSNLVLKDFSYLNEIVPMNIFHTVK